MPTEAESVIRMLARNSTESDTEPPEDDTTDDQEDGDIEDDQEVEDDEEVEDVEDEEDNEDDEDDGEDDEEGAEKEELSLQQQIANLQADLKVERALREAQTMSQRNDTEEKPRIVPPPGPASITDIDLLENVSEDDFDELLSSPRKFSTLVKMIREQALQDARQVLRTDLGDMLPKTVSEMIKEQETTERTRKEFRTKHSDLWADVKSNDDKETIDNLIYSVAQQLATSKPELQQDMTAFGDAIADKIRTLRGLAKPSKSMSRREKRKKVRRKPFGQAGGRGVARSQKTPVKKGEDKTNEIIDVVKAMRYAGG